MKLQFSAHETFHIRDGWLGKGLRALGDDPGVFSREYPEEDLGVGHNMVKSIRYWLLAAGLMEAAEKAKNTSKSRFFQPTPFAKKLLAADQYFENENTWFAIHAHLVSNKDSATSWYWLFNEFPSRRFDEESFLAYLKDYIAATSKGRYSDRSLANDFRVLTRSYVLSHEDLKADPEEAFACPMARLGLMEYLPNTRTYRLLEPSAEYLNAFTIGYILARFREAVAPTSKTIAFRDALRAPLGPGRIFNLSGDRLLEAIHELEQAGLVSYFRTAGLDQVMFNVEGPAAFLDGAIERVMV